MLVWFFLQAETWALGVGPCSQVHAVVRAGLYKDTRQCKSRGPSPLTSVYIFIFIKFHRVRD